MSYRNSRYSVRYETQWPAYVTVAERRRLAALEMEKLRKKGIPVSPVRIEGKKIAATFWGKAWCDNLESYRDYENRLGRGRSYVRNGSVVDLQIAPREVTALVSGSEIYKVKVSISEVAKAHWKSICADCSGGIDSVVELLRGRLSQGVMERICRQGAGLFPKPAELEFSCSCPDWASMCKHVAAVLYGVGARLDVKPELLFRMRAVDEKDLVADIGEMLPMAKQAPAAGKVLEQDDIAALFGLDMGEAEEIGGDASAVAKVDPPSRRERKPVAPKRAVVAAKAGAQVSNASREPIAGRKPVPSPTARKPVEVAPSKRRVRVDAAPQEPVVTRKSAPAPAVRKSAAQAPAKQGARPSATPPEPVGTRKPVPGRVKELAASSSRQNAGPSVPVHKAVRSKSKPKAQS